LAASPLDTVPDDEPVAVAEPTAPAPANALVGTESEDALALHRIRNELDEMRRLISLTGDLGGRQGELMERLNAIEARVSEVEERGDDQEAALRRVLTLLVDWVENDGQQGARAA